MKYNLTQFLQAKNTQKLLVSLVIDTRAVWDISRPLTAHLFQLARKRWASSMVGTLRVATHPLQRGRP